MKIRKATSADVKSIAKVHVDSWRTTYRNIVPDEHLNELTYESKEQQWEYILSKATVFVAENEKDEIVGFANGGPERSGDYPGFDGELYAIYVLAEYQHKGIGKMLMEPLVEELKEQGIFSMIVCVLEDNPSRQFYEKLGAKRIDTLKIEIEGKELNESVYGWEDIRGLVK
ncbi:GNAT family N-acetyltransferase [Fictibacillus aquaticus]|uniref:GNAT family N-acetyltransferase n=1 Tax=Fictibacillus aquaticus TaxID=2021314 RepID=A0A235FDA3_9BACL|nr:GNAT family N-acetyltransferase [Fictibacillus aquaticus]OYD59326.1 GNAT family N-acetyltransferase [Fictibacillus aquaticus]